ncbi:DUF6435 family protein [Halomonas nitroreducens]|uniref:Lacal_2735 family protein n=1 Tax=Halomonas nitroreducens TaxID=447425 RepID=A0A3S0K5C2_9GAMM|nr:DUF6435 family protein [Halomonas nitroreducens]RTR06106.1 Lacal_2735 family protein [Halomonas nitroreducens]
MLSWLKRDPAKRLQRDYERKLEQAMEAARNGDMRANASLTEEAEALREAIDRQKGV